VDAGAYYYNIPSRPYAVATIVPVPGSFPSESQNISHTAFNKVENITEGNFMLSLNYGPNHERILQNKLNLLQGTQQQTRYFTPLYEVVDEDDSQKLIHYFSSPTGIFAIFTIENGNNGRMKYVLKDHQGSLAALVNEKSGTEYFSFDAWGRRRNAQTWTYTNMPISFGTTRGFTMHEHLDEFKLINMNGRMYDPVVSRMLSPDNFIQAPDFSQSFNRYSYCANNPLKYTDPIGEVFGVDDALLILAVAYFGGVQANFLYSSGNSKNPFNPGNWNWNSPWTYIGIASGALAGYTMGIEHCEYLIDINTGEEVLFSHLGDGKLNFNHFGTWLDNHTAFKSYYTTIQDVPLGGVDNMRNIANNAFVINNTIGDASYFNTKKIDNSRQATQHYLFGDGSSVRIGSKTTTQLINSPEFSMAHNEIINRNTQISNSFSVNMKSKVFHIGRTSVNYKVNNGHVTYEIYANDGFWDPDYIDEMYFSKFYGRNSKFVPDGPAPNLERFGGKPYRYLPTYISLPFRSY
jgi:RHS repeat-associated protein